MATKSKSGTEETPTAMTEALSKLQQAGFTNMMGMGTAWTEAVSDLGAEVVSFVAERIKEDVKAQQEILHCKSVAELQNIQARFFQKALDQYQDETGKLFKMGASVFAADTEKRS